MFLQHDMENDRGVMVIGHCLLRTKHCRTTQQFTNWLADLILLWMWYQYVFCFNIWLTCTKGILWHSKMIAVLQTKYTEHFQNIITNQLDWSHIFMPHILLHRLSTDNLAYPIGVILLLSCLIRPKKIKAVFPVSYLFNPKFPICKISCDIWKKFNNLAQSHEFSISTQNGNSFTCLVIFVIILP
jgi:hypothetical protein